MRRQAGPAAVLRRARRLFLCCCRRGRALLLPDNRAQTPFFSVCNRFFRANTPLCILRRAVCRRGTVFSLSVYPCPRRYSARFRRCTGLCTVRAIPARCRLRRFCREDTERRSRYAPFWAKNGNAAYYRPERKTHFFRRGRRGKLRSRKNRRRFSIRPHA